MFDPATLTDEQVEWGISALLEEKKKRAEKLEKDLWANVLSALREYVQKTGDPIAIYNDEGRTSYLYADDFDSTKGWEPGTLEISGF